MPSTIKLGSIGSDVSLCQDSLNKIGTDPKLIVDGHFGVKTDGAVRRFQDASHIVIDGIVGPDTWTAINAVLRATPPVTPPPSPIPGVEFYDRRKYASQAHGPEKQWPVTIRPIEQVTGACAHQTACLLGERPERYDSVGAHFGVTRMGKVIWLHDFTHEVAAANGWNNGTVSIEFDGLYAGEEGNPSSVWDDPSTPSKEQAMVLTPEMIRAGIALLRWIKQCLGVRMNAIVAHRQASDSRRNDPGSAIWQNIVIPMHVELCCTDGGIGFTLDDGLPIPESWDSRCAGISY